MIGKRMIAAGFALAGPAVVVSAVVASSVFGSMVSAHQAAPDPPSVQTSAAVAQAPILPVTIVARYPHDTRAFTEGLLWHDGALYESTGQERQSDVRRVDLTTGKVLAKRLIPPEQFGEGLALWNGDLISLTWHNGIAHRWNVRTLRSTGTNRYTGEGWGMTSDAKGLIQSDGSPVLIFRDPATLAETRRVAVTIDGRALPQINELEYVRGAVLANVWQTGFLVRIDPANGKVTAIIDLRPLVAEVGAIDRDAVLNGIAWDAKHDRLFVTGKYWPTLFEITIGH